MFLCSKRFMRAMALPAQVRRAVMPSRARRSKPAKLARTRGSLSDKSIGEDPATGSAAGPLGGYLVYHDATSVDPIDGAYKFVIEQGDFINRPSRIGLEVKGAPGNVEEVRVGGQSVVVATGVLEF